MQLKRELQIIGEASDGQEAVQKAEELQPDLILLDVGLPTLNGMEVARRVRKCAPNTRFLFVSQESSTEVIQECLGLGAMGYVLKTHARTELLQAIETVLDGERFVGSGLEFITNADGQAPHDHAMLIYSSEGVLLDSFTRFLAPALRVGNPAIVITTKSHQDDLVHRLRTESVDVDAAAQRGTYTALDAVHAFSGIMVDGLPDPVRFFESFGSLMEAATRAANMANPRVAFCGEGLGILWAESKADAAIRLEQLTNDLAKRHGIDILCAYPMTGFHGDHNRDAFTSICAQHSALHYL